MEISFGCCHRSRDMLPCLIVAMDQYPFCLECLSQPGKERRGCILMNKYRLNSVACRRVLDLAVHCNPYSHIDISKGIHID